jgi:N-acetylglucosaminyldiphosphoundecaprenol N-acetyl-beta-D-mannosaminyltransferase
MLGRIEMHSLDESANSTNSVSNCVPVRLLGVDISPLRLEGLVRIAGECITRRKRLLIGVVNAAKLVNARKDGELRRALEEADVVVADGVPVVWLSRLIGTPLPERIAGIDIMFALLKEADRKHYSVYFLGARHEIVRKVVETVGRDFPGVHVAGYRDGYFSGEDEEEVANDIREHHPDIIFVAISPPKKEIFLRTWGDVMDVPVCHGVGGSFDVMAGVTKRAPLWMQKWGMEWFYRFLQEPRRMWKRYLVTNSIFVWLSLIEIAAHRLGFRRSKKPEGKDLMDPSRAAGSRQ